MKVEGEIESEDLSVTLSASWKGGVWTSGIRSRLLLCTSLSHTAKQASAMHRTESEASGAVLDAAQAHAPTTPMRVTKSAAAGNAVPSGSSMPPVRAWMSGTPWRVAARCIDRAIHSGRPKSERTPLRVRENALDDRTTMAFRSSLGLLLLWLCLCSIQRAHSTVSEWENVLLEAKEGAWKSAAGPQSDPVTSLNSWDSSDSACNGNW